MHRARNNELIASGHQTNDLGNSLENNDIRLNRRRDNTIKTLGSDIEGAAILNQSITDLLISLVKTKAGILIKLTNDVLIANLKRIHNILSHIIGMTAELANSTVCHEVSTKANTISCSRSAVQNSILNQITQSITIRLRDTANHQLNKVRLQSVNTTLKGTNHSSIFTIILSILQTRLEIAQQVIVGSREGAIRVLHIYRIDEASLGVSCNYLITGTAEVLNGIRRRSITCFNIMLQNLRIDILTNSITIAEQADIGNFISLMIAFNYQERQLISHILLRHQISHTTHNSTQILRQLRSNDNRRNQSGFLTLYKLRIGLDKVLRHNSIEENSHLLSIDRMLEEVNTRMIQNSFVILISNKARITETSIQSHTIIRLDYSITVSGSTDINEDFHTIVIIDILNGIRDKLIAISRDHRDIVDIFRRSLMTRALDIGTDLINYRFESIQNLNRRLIILLADIHDCSIDLCRQHNRRSGAITNSLNDMTSNRLDIVLNRLLNDTMEIDIFQNGMTILGIDIESILFLHTGIGTHRAKRVCKNVRQSLQYIVLNLMQSVLIDYVRNHSIFVHNHFPFLSNWILNLKKRFSDNSKTIYVTNLKQDFFRKK
nr:MAG TPA: hypothetical protein [Caudoviricetes sp.]